MNIYYCYNHTRSCVVYARDEANAITTGWGKGYLSPGDNSLQYDPPVVQYLGYNTNVTEQSIIVAHTEQP